MLVLQHVVVNSALDRCGLRPGRHVDRHTGYNTERAQRHTGKIQLRLGVDHGLVAIRPHDRERRNRLGKDRLGDRGAIDVDGRHAANAKKPAGSDRLQHELVSAEKCI